MSSISLRYNAYSITITIAPLKILFLDEIILNIENEQSDRETSWAHWFDLDEWSFLFGFEFRKKVQDNVILFSKHRDTKERKRERKMPVHSSL